MTKHDLSYGLGLTACAAAFAGCLWISIYNMRHRVSPNTDTTEILRLLKSDTEQRIILWKIFFLRPNIDPDLAADIARNVAKFAAKYDRDPNLVLAIMRVESNFDPRAESVVGARGLMQVMPLWIKSWHIDDDLYNVESSIKWGLKILAFYQATYQDLPLAITAYNRGPGAVDADLRRGVDPANGYELKVLELFEKLNALDGAL